MSTTEQYIQKGKEAIKNNNAIGAKDMFRKAVELSPHSADPKVELARIEVTFGNLKEAELLVEESLILQPEHALGLSLKGMLKILSKKYSEAISFLEKAISLNPKLSMAYKNLGIAQMKIGMLKQSEENFQKVIAIDSNDFEAHYGLAQTLCHAGKMKEGILATLESIKINPLFVKGYQVLGALYSRAGRPDLAEAIYDECLKRIPNAILIREKLVELYLKYKRADAALAEMEVVAVQRGSMNDWMRLGILSISERKLKAAEAAFQQAALVAPQAWEPHYNLGNLYDASKLTDLAGKEYELAVKFNAENYKPHNGYGLWLIKQNRINESIEQLSKAQQLADRAPEPAYNLALVLANTGQKNQAKRLLREINLIPSSGRIQQDAARLLTALS